MDGYIHKRRKGGGSGLFKGLSITRKKTAEPAHEEREFKKAEVRPDVKKGVKKMDDAYEELEDVEEIDEKPAGMPEKKGGGIKGFFKKFKSGKPHIEEVEDDMPAVPEGDLPEDVKEVLKTSLKWIQELPPARLKDFRNSPDFEKFKEVLVKYKVAKPTQKQ